MPTRPPSSCSMCSSTRSVLSPTEKHQHSWPDGHTCGVGPSGAGPAGGAPGAELRSSGHQDAHVPVPAPRTKVSRTAPPKCARVGPGMLGVGARRSPARSPPSPHRWVNPKAPKGHVSAHKAVGGSSKSREATARIIQPSPRPMTCISWGGSHPTGEPGSLVRFWPRRALGGLKGGVSSSSRQMQPPKPAALPGGARARASLLPGGLNPGRPGAQG